MTQALKPPREATMSIVDQIAAATGLTQILNRPQAKQAGLANEAGAPDAKSLAVRARDGDAKTPVVVTDTAWAGRVLINGTEAIDKTSAQLGKAMEIAKQALSSPLDAQAGMAEKFNAHLRDSAEELDKATAERGVTLVGRQSKPMIAVTSEGGQVKVADLGTGGIDLVGKATWLDRQAIQQSVNQLETALITLSETRAQFSQAEYTLSLAAELNHGTALVDYRFQASNAAAVIDGAANAEWEAEAKRTVAEEANREASLREAFAG
jgi:hypothetical protein